MSKLQGVLAVVAVFSIAIVVTMSTVSTSSTGGETEDQPTLLAQRENVNSGLVDINTPMPIFPVIEDVDQVVPVGTPEVEGASTSAPATPLIHESDANRSTVVLVQRTIKTKPKPRTNSNRNTNTPTPPPPPPPASGEVRITSYNTGYGWPDNTPPGGEVSNPVLHSSAGGTGTYADPITLAVGHSISGGQDTLDYPQGTRFYIPALRRYFMVEDTCGDGNTPQNGPCHKSEVANTVQLDLWVGGQGASKSAVLNCEDNITGVHLAIKNPAQNYVVVSGPIFNGSCSQLYGDTVVTK